MQIVVDCAVVRDSYCWENSSFVLNRLAPELAMVVEDLWLDRLGGNNGMGEVSRRDFLVPIYSSSF